jgi:hypothetical protein
MDGRPELSPLPWKRKAMSAEKVKVSHGSRTTAATAGNLGGGTTAVSRHNSTFVGALAQTMSNIIT